MAQLGYNLRAELRQKLAALFDYARGLDFEGLRARVETVVPLGHGGGEGQNLPVGGGTMVADAGRSESGFLNDSFFSDANGGSVRELLLYNLVQTAPYLIIRFHLFGDRLVLSPQLRLAVDLLRIPGRPGRRGARPRRGGPGNRQRGGADAGVYRAAPAHGGRQLFQEGRVVGLPIFPELWVRADF